MEKIIKEIIDKKRECVFISPHLDDAIFSAGGLMHKMHRSGTKIITINVFTKPSPAPYTLSVRKFLRSCGYKNANELFKDRINEDRKALLQVSTGPVNLGFVDALWRRKNSRGLLKSLSKILPEFDYIYPVYIFSIAQGRVSNWDYKLYDLIQDRLSSVLNEYRNPVVFAPLGIGMHVDHLIVRDVVRKLPYDKIYWTDYPYIKTASTDRIFIKQNRLKRFEVKISKTKKENLVNMYVSQVKAIFGKEKETVPVKEYYYLPYKKLSK